MLYCKVLPLAGIVDAAWPGSIAAQLSARNHCPGKILVEGRGVYCLNIRGIRIDEAVTRLSLRPLNRRSLALLLPLNS